MIFCDQDSLAMRDQELQTALGAGAAQGNEAAQAQVSRRVVVCNVVDSTALISFCRWI